MKALLQQLGQLAQLHSERGFSDQNLEAARRRIIEGAPNHFIERLRRLAGQNLKGEMTAAAFEQELEALLARKPAPPFIPQARVGIDEETEAVFDAEPVILENSRPTSEDYKYGRKRRWPHMSAEAESELREKMDAEADGS